MNASSPSGSAASAGLDARNKQESTTLNLGIYLAIVFSMIAILVADVQTPLGTAVWVFYTVPLVLSLWLRHSALPLVIASVCTLFMLGQSFIDAPGMVRDIANINRNMGIVTTWIIALVGVFFIRYRNATNLEEWMRIGKTELHARMTGEQPLQELGANILGFLNAYLGAHAAAMYVQDGDAYHRIATRGVAAQGAPDRFSDGEGLLGQVAGDGEPVLISQVPEGYLTLSSALGSSKPQSLIIVPVMVEGVPNGVIELGFLKQLDAGAIELLKRLEEPIGTAVRSANYRLHMQSLLEETQRQAEELQAQGEELRVSNEELEEQGRSLQESQSRLELQQAELEQTNTQLEEQTQQLEMQRDDLEKAQASLEQHSHDLQRASQYKSDFLANMSHELRTPLNSTLILAKLLADNTGGNLTDEQIRHAETIRSAGNDLLNLINDILDLSKIEAGHTEVIPETIQVTHMIDHLVRGFEPLARDKSIGLDVTIDPATPVDIYTDVKRIEQILRNLLSNAIKFTSEGSVALEVKPVDDRQLAFIVRDTGIGIAPDQHDIVFEAFRQADGTTNRKYGGTGLGLSISRELARLLGGDIALQSELDAGSTFTVTIPIHYESGNEQRPVPSHLASLAPPSPAQNRESLKFKEEEPTLVDSNDETSAQDDRFSLTGQQRVLLVVEDDESFARILYDLAREQGFQCLLAGTADEALQLAARYLPSAVILDVGLPDHSGLSVLDRLKQDPRTRHIPVHVISAEDHSRTAFSLGAVGYMLKPVRHEEVLSTLQQFEQRLVQRMRRILVVEDDPVQRESVQKLLSSHAVETVGVGTAADCLDELRSGTFDCMVLDLSLPDASGYSLLETLSNEEDYAFPPVIVYTGRDLSADEEQQLRRYSKSIIIKGAKSPERLLDEVTLFLHQVVSELPAEQQSMLRKSRNRDAVLEGRRILIVEDDVRNVYSLSNILEPRGAKVQVARNGQEAIEALENADAESRIDLVLMDVMMPVMDGIAATRSIRASDKWKKLPIIMLTAKAMHDDQEQCLNAGANDYMAKPLDVEKLLSLVRVWMPR